MTALPTVVWRRTVLMNPAGGEWPGPPVVIADTAWARLRGLLGRQWLLERGALLLTPCAAVHTLGMRVPLDLLFLNRHGAIIALVQGLRPQRCQAAWSARSVLEMAAGGVMAWRAHVGDTLQLDCGQAVVGFCNPEGAPSDEQEGMDFPRSERPRRGPAADAASVRGG